MLYPIVNIVFVELTGAGFKKCRVSGLSRSKSKASPVDEKQQKIKDMFSKFARNK